MCIYILLATHNVLHVQIIQDMYNIQFLNAEKMTSNILLTVLQVTTVNGFTVMY